MKIAEHIVIILICYGLGTLVIYLISDRMIFVPPTSSYTDTANIVKIATKDGKSISAIYIKNHHAKYTVLFSHGNAEDLGMVFSTLQDIYTMGFSVLAYDYNGYGTSSGHPSEHGSYENILAAYNYLLREQAVEPKHIILFGRSLGSGPTIELAKNKQIGGVVLQAPFISAYRVVTYYPIFLFDKFRNLSKINDLSVPVLIVHGKQDRVVPFWHGEKIYENYNGNKSYYWVEGAGHNDLDFATYPEYREKFINFSQQLPE